MEYILGIDIGTGSVKAVAVDMEGNGFEVCQQHYSFSSPKPGYHEQDPEQIWLAFTASIKGIIEKIGLQPVAISLSSALHSFIPVDAGCTPLYPMITWADSRSWEIAKKLRASAEGMAIYKATGTPLHAMSPLCKLIWLKENNPDLFSSAHKFIGIKDYIWYKLFKEFKTDHSIASGMGLFNITKLAWDKDALKLAGVNEDRLPEPVPTDHFKKYEPANNSDALGFLSPGLPFVIGGGDGCLANLGSMADKPGIAAMTIGTSGAVRVASSKPLPNETAMTFSYILDKDTFICGGPINNGGIAFQWWLKNVIEKPESDYDKILKQIGEIPAGSNGLIFLPYLTGDRAPIWDSESCGNFFGVTLQHTQAHFSRAVLEGICYAMKDVLNAVQQNSEQITQVNVSGGFTRSDVWVQALADICNVKMVIAQTEDASAVGAAFIAMKGLGLVKEYPSADISNLKTFMPNPANTEVYERNFNIYRQLYRNLKDTMHSVCNS